MPSKTSAVRSGCLVRDSCMAILYWLLTSSMLAQADLAVMFGFLTLWVVGNWVYFDKFAKIKRYQMRKVDPLVKRYEA